MIGYRQIVQSCVNGFGDSGEERHLRMSSRLIELSLARERLDCFELRAEDRIVWRSVVFRESQGVLTSSSSSELCGYRKLAFFVIV